jgi:hypothetical protein
MSNLPRAALLSTVLSCTLGCSFFQLDDKDLEIHPKPPEAAAGKAAEAAAGTSTGGMSATPEETGGMGATAEEGGGSAGM